MIQAIKYLGMAACAAVAMHATVQADTLEGQFYGSGDYSIYSFNTLSAEEKTKVAQIDVEPNCGSVRTSDRFYCFTCEPGDYGDEYRVYVYDTTDNYSLVTAIGSAWAVAKPGQVLACDPMTDEIYSVYEESSYYGSSYYLGKVNLSNRTMTKIGDSLYFGYGNTHIVAMAFDPMGQLYAIASNSNLYRLDKSTASLISVGSTGFTPSYEQSMAFSEDGSKIYWAACNDYVSALYEVDPVTANAVKIKDFNDDEEYASLWLGAPAVSDGAPGQATAISATFVDGSLSGKITFTTPSLTYGGDPLEGEIGFAVKSGDDLLVQGTAMAGSEVTATVTVAESGLYRFQIICTNTSGYGEPVTLDAGYIGIDTPQFVENLTLEPGATNEQFIISWDAPTEGMHGGYIDPSAIKYRLRRLPDFDLLSNDAISPYTDSFISDKPVKGKYEVTPYLDDSHQGLPLTTPFVMTGTPYPTPYVEDFATSAKANEWTVIDANDDGHTWEYQWDFGYFRAYDNNNPKDEWLISPYILLEADHQYSLKFKVRTIATEQLEVRFGTTLSPAGLTLPALEPVTIPDTDFEWQERTASIYIPQTGRYHIGFHALTADPSSALALYLDDIRLDDEGSQSVLLPSDDSAIVAPYTVSGTTVTACLPITLTVTTPDGRSIANANLSAGQSITLPPGLCILSTPATAPRTYLLR